MTAAAQSQSYVPPRAKATGPSTKWIIAFMLVPMTCQLLLLLPPLAPMRALLRSVAFINGLLYLLLLPGKAGWHPSGGLLLAALLVVVLSFFNPSTNSLLSGAAHVVFYISIASPLFWVSRMRITPLVFRRMLQLIWGFQSLSALFGALQIYYPGQFQPPTASILPDAYLAGLQISLANGEHVLRPMGLTDSPGGAAIAGFYSVLLGVGFFLEGGTWAKILAGLSMVLGVFVLYLCQVRSSFVTLSVCLIVMSVAWSLQGKAGRAAGVGLTMAGVGVVAFVLALRVGGEHTFDRLNALFADDPATVYTSNRGMFLSAAFSDLLPRYPLGAGLGRWGMIATYFGDMTDPDRLPIWAEIQWSGWIIDGGLPLLVLYSLAIASATALAFRIVSATPRLRLGHLGDWAVLLLGYNLGAIASTFSFPVFMAPAGQEFWLLNAALFAAVSNARRE